MKKQTPGTVLNALLKKHGLNYSSLAKAIGLSGAMVRLIALDENPVSADVAFRLAKFFKTSPEYWLDLQGAYNIARTAKDKKLAKALKAVTTVDKIVKKKAAKPGRKAKVKKPAKKTAGKRGRPAKKTGAGKIKPAGKRGRPAVKKPAVRRGRPASKTKAKPKVKRAVKAKSEPRPVAPAPQPVNQPARTVNEPNI